MNEITALTKDKLLLVLGFIGNHDNPIPINYIQCLYDKYGDKYNFELDKCELISENHYWRSGWKDKNGTFANDFQKYKRELNGKKTKALPIMGTTICECYNCKHLLAEDMNYCPACRYEIIEAPWKGEKV